MKKYIHSDYNYLDDIDEVFGMSDLVPKKSGLSVIIWSDHGVIRRNKPDTIPRVKLMKALEESISVSIEQNPKVLAPKGDWTKKFKKDVVSDMKEGIAYISRNYDLFLQHYNDTTDNFDTEDLISALRQRGEYK